MHAAKLRDFLDQCPTSVLLHVTPGRALNSDKICLWLGDLEICVSQLRGVKENISSRDSQVYKPTSWTARATQGNPVLKNQINKSDINKQRTLKENHSRVRAPEMPGLEDQVPDTTTRGREESF